MPLLGEGLLQVGREVLGDAQRLDGDVDGGHAGGGTRGAREDVRGGGLLELDVVVVLQHEVRHHLGVLLRHLVAVLLQRGLGRERPG